VDNQVLISESKVESQISAHHLNTTAERHKLKISPSKTKSVSVCGSDIRRLNIVTK